MSKLRHTLQLLHGGALSTRQIGAVLGISKSTVSEIASYARVAGVDWALAQSLSDEELHARLYRPPVARESRHLNPTTSTSTANCAAPASPCNCYVRSTSSNTQAKPTSTAPSARSTRPGRGV